MNALLTGAVISLLFVFLVYYSPSHNVHLWFITYPANINALLLLCLVRRQRHLPLVPADRDRRDDRPRRGWVPEGSFRLGKWGWTVSIIAALYLGLMLLNVVVSRPGCRAGVVSSTTTGSRSS